MITPREKLREIARKTQARVLDAEEAERREVKIFKKPKPTISNLSNHFLKQMEVRESQEIDEILKPVSALIEGLKHFGVNAHLETYPCKDKELWVGPRNQPTKEKKWIHFEALSAGWYATVSQTGASVFLFEETETVKLIEEVLLLSTARGHLKALKRQEERGATGTLQISGSVQERYDTRFEYLHISKEQLEVLTNLKKGEETTLKVDLSYRKIWEIEELNVEEMSFQVPFVSVDEIKVKKK